MLLAIAGSEDNVFSVDEFEDLEGGFHHEVFSSQVRTSTAHIKNFITGRLSLRVLNEIKNSQNDSPIMDHTCFEHDGSHAVRFVASSSDESHVVRFVDSRRLVKRNFPPPARVQLKKHSILRVDYSSEV